MLFKEKKSDFILDNEKNIQAKIKQSNFVFSYCFGLLSQEKTNFTRLVVLDEEIMIKRLYTDSTKNVDRTFKKPEQTKQIKDYFLQKGVINQLETINNIPSKDLKVYKNSRIDQIYLKVNGKVYKFYGNSANPEYRKFLEKIIKKVYAILNIDYSYSNNKYKVLLKAPASWNEYDADKYGHTIFKFKTINIPNTEVLFKFWGIVSFSPALYGQYTVERIGYGTLEEFDNAFDDFIKFVSAENNNYKLIKKEKIDFKEKIVNRAFIRYVNSNITSIIDYLYVDNNIIVIGCPLCLNMSDEETLNSKNIQLHNRVIQTINILEKNNNKDKIKEEIINKIDKKIAELNSTKLNNSCEFNEYEELKNQDHVLIQSWFGKKQIVVDEFLVTFGTENAGYVYEYHNKNGFENESDNGIKIKKICRLNPILLADLRKYIVSDLNIFNIQIMDGMSLDKGNKISIKIGNQSLIIKDNSDYYDKINTKLNELLIENKKILNQISNTIKGETASDKKLPTQEELNQIFKSSENTFFYLHGSLHNKNYKLIRLVDDYIIKEEFVNGVDCSKTIQDKDLSSKVWNVINSNIDKIKMCSEKIKNLDRIVDGVSDSIQVKSNGNVYGFSSKVNDEEIKKVYNELIESVLSYIKI